jgi:hypothetical protein
MSHGHGIFERCKKEPESLEEQLTGRRKSTQFGRIMEELDIVSPHHVLRKPREGLSGYGEPSNIG